MDITQVEEFLKTKGYTGWELSDEFELLDHQMISHGRWTIWCLDVYADPDGHVFGIVYDIPSTEQQEGSESGEAQMAPVDTVTSWSFA